MDFLGVLSFNDDPNPFQQNIFWKSSTQNIKRPLLSSPTDYCAPIWDPFVECHKSKAMKINSRAASVVWNRIEPCDHVGEPDGWGPTWGRHTGQSETPHKGRPHVQDQSPTDGITYPTITTGSPYILQFPNQISDYSIPHKKCQNSSCPRTILHWNRLPTKVVDCPSADSFKQKTSKPSM